MASMEAKVAPSECVNARFRLPWPDWFHQQHGNEPVGVLIMSDKAHRGRLPFLRPDGGCGTIRRDETRFVAGKTANDDAESEYQQGIYHYGLSPFSGPDGLLSVTRMRVTRFLSTSSDKMQSGELQCIAGLQYLV